jgi:hypothetical protein
MIALLAGALGVVCPQGVSSACSPLTRVQQCVVPHDHPGQLPSVLVAPFSVAPFTQPLATPSLPHAAFILCWREESLSWTFQNKRGP